MSQTAVLNYIETQIEAIKYDGDPLSSRLLECRQGIPQAGTPGTIEQFPLVVLSVRDMEPVRLTAGAAGNVMEKYAVIITLYLGPKECAHDVVLARQKLFPSRIRSKFAGDNHLGGNCFNCDIKGPATNTTLDAGSGMPAYKLADAYPLQQWAIIVEESIAANAAAIGE